MLSSNPSIPLSSIDFADNEGRRLSLVTAEGRKMLTPHDGLPSPGNLSPVAGGTPTENGSDFGEGADIADERSRQMRYSDDDESTLNTVDVEQPVGAMHHRLSKVPSRGGIWHPDPRWVSHCFHSHSAGGVFLNFFILVCFECYSWCGFCDGDASQERDRHRGKSIECFILLSAHFRAPLLFMSGGLVSPISLQHFRSASWSFTFVSIFKSASYGGTLSLYQPSHLRCLDYHYFGTRLGLALLVKTSIGVSPPLHARWL